MFLFFRQFDPQVLLFMFLFIHVLISLKARDEFIQSNFLQKVWQLQFVNQIKWIKKAVVSCDVTGGITLGTKLKMPIFTLYLPHNLQSRVLACQKFIQLGYKRLVRLGSKCPNWQRSQPISYKAKFSQRYNIYLVDLKRNITYQNIRGESKVRPIFIPWNT